jgi:hypothetical protein
LFKSKEKHLKQGEKISKCFFQSYSYTFDYLQRIFKRIFQRICKNKTCGASMVQNVKIEESNLCISSRNKMLV